MMESAIRLRRDAAVFPASPVLTKEAEEAVEAPG